MEEVWKDINGYEGYYQISNLGRTKSLSRKMKNLKGISIERILKPGYNRDGYILVVLCTHNKPRTFAVHRLVAMAFLPLKEGKDCVNHIDGNKKNNSVTNLERVNRSENTLHAFRTGLLLPTIGELHPLARITEDEAREIFNEFQQSKPPWQIAKDFKVSYATVYFIGTKRTWKHIHKMENK